MALRRYQHKFLQPLEIDQGRITTNLDATKATIQSLDSSSSNETSTTLRQLTQTSINQFDSVLNSINGTLTIDVSRGTILLGDLDFTVTTWSFINFPTQNNRATTITAVVDGDTAQTYGSFCTVNGIPVADGIRWSGGNAPTATNFYDLLVFNIVRDESGKVSVFGSATTGHRNPTPYTTRGLIFDFDPSRLSFADGTFLANGANLTAASSLSLITGITGTTVTVNNGGFNYQTAANGHINSNTNSGRISVTGASLASALDACASITLTCWFQSNGLGRQVLLSRFGAGFPNQFNHIVDPTGDFHCNSSGAITGSSVNIDSNAWSNNTWALSHWVYNVSDGVARWFVNGSQVATAGFGTDGGAGLTVSGGASGFGIMSRGDDLERLFGRMGPVRIHNVALTASEITSEWLSERARFGV